MCGFLTLLTVTLVGVFAGLIGLLGWLQYRVVLKQRRLRLRLQVVEQELEQLGAGIGLDPQVLARGLEAGTLAVDFDMPNLHGGRMTLRQWQGRSVLLVFINPRCPFSLQALPAFAALPMDGRHRRPVPILVTMGEEHENRILLSRYELRCPVLLQDGQELAAVYKVTATPVGYLIDERGVLAGELTGGAAALLALGRASTHGAQQRVSRLPPEKMVRQGGLFRGEPAPVFRLPRVGGGEVYLGNYRGRRILVAFLDPECDPCHDVAVELQRIHGTRTDLEVVAVSRGSEEANRAMVAEHGLTIPIGLQRHWEISREYGTLLTPAGVFIDESGKAAAYTALGKHSVLELIARLVATSTPGP